MWQKRISVTVVVLTGLLVVIVSLPIIQQSREAARRLQCQNNFKQIGTALYTYESAYGVFPSGFEIGANSPYLGWGWSIRLMAYIDSWPNYNQVRFDSGMQNEASSIELNPHVQSFRCPSDRGPATVEHAYLVSTDVSDGVVTPRSTDLTNTLARSNYFGVAGYLHTDAGGIKYDANGNPPATGLRVNAASLGNVGSSFSIVNRYCDQKNFRGVFGQNSCIRISDINNGTSAVFTVGERYSPTNSSIGAVGHGTWLGVPDCTTAAGLAMSLGDTSVKLTSGNRGRAETTGFGSMHSGGALFLMADGSVKFIADTMDIGTYRNLSTIGDDPSPNDGK